MALPKVGSFSAENNVLAGTACIFGSAIAGFSGGIGVVTVTAGASTGGAVTTAGGGSSGGTAAAGGVASTDGGVGAGGAGSVAAGGGATFVDCAIVMRGAAAKVPATNRHNK